MQKRSAECDSGVAECTKNDIDPQKWLTYVMQNINDTKTSGLKYLLPQFIDKSRLI